MHRNRWEKSLDWTSAVGQSTVTRVTMVKVKGQAVLSLDSLWLQLQTMILHTCTQNLLYICTMQLVLDDWHMKGICHLSVMSVCLSCTNTFRYALLLLIKTKISTKQKALPWGKLFLWNSEFKCFFKFWKQSSTHNLTLSKMVFVSNEGFISRFIITDNG